MTIHARLHILFPPNDVELAFDRASPIDLHAAGGTPPYAWTADGLPITAEAGQGGTAWTARGPGFAHLTVTDSPGNSASADVRLTAE